MGLMTEMKKLEEDLISEYNRILYTANRLGLIEATGFVRRFLIRMAVIGHIHRLAHKRETL